MKRRNGRTSWIELGLTAPVRGAIVEPDRIAFDMATEGLSYSVSLTRAPAGPPWWMGTWRCKTDASHGHAQAKLYSASDGGVVLVGTWNEDGDQYWFTELT